MGKDVEFIVELGFPVDRETVEEFRVTAGEILGLAEVEGVDTGPNEHFPDLSAADCIKSFRLLTGARYFGAQLRPSWSTPGVLDCSDEYARGYWPSIRVVLSRAVCMMPHAAVWYGNDQGFPSFFCYSPPMVEAFDKLWQKHG